MREYCEVSAALPLLVTARAQPDRRAVLATRAKRERGNGRPDTDQNKALIRAISAVSRGGYLLCAIMRRSRGTAWLGFAHSVVAGSSSTWRSRTLRPRLTSQFAIMQVIVKDTSAPEIIQSSGRVAGAGLETVSAARVTAAPTVKKANAAVNQVSDGSCTWRSRTRRGVARSPSEAVRLPPPARRLRLASILSSESLLGSPKLGSVTPSQNQ